MTLHSKTLILSAFVGLIVGGCAPQKKEEASAPVAPAPFAQPEEVTPDETQGLSLPEQEELKIDEDNVMNPFPG